MWGKNYGEKRANLRITRSVVMTFQMLSLYAFDSRMWILAWQIVGITTLAILICLEEPIFCMGNEQIWGLLLNFDIYPCHKE